MITAKQAASEAATYLADLVPIISMPLIEEVELSNDRSIWRITLSYTSQESAQLAFLGNAKSYKVFSIDAENGQVLAMKIRDTK